MRRQTLESLELKTSVRQSRTEIHGAPVMRIGQQVQRQLEHEQVPADHHNRPDARDAKPQPRACVGNG